MNKNNFYLVAASADCYCVSTFWKRNYDLPIQFYGNVAFRFPVFKNYFYIYCTNNDLCKKWKTIDDDDILTIIKCVIVNIILNRLLNDKLSFITNIYFNDIHLVLLQITKKKKLIFTKVLVANIVKRSVLIKSLFFSGIIHGNNK